MAPEHAGGAPQTETGTQPSGSAPVFRQPRAPFLDVLGKLSQQRAVVLGIAGVIVFFAVWEVAHYVTPEEKQRFLPSVELVVGEIVYLFAEKNFIADVGTSLYRIYVSFFAASLIAVPLGVLMGCFVKLRALISPTTGGWRYLPAASFAPLLLVWFGPSDFAKMALLFLGCFFFLVALILDNTLSVQRELIESGLTMGANRRRVVTTGDDAGNFVGPVMRAGEIADAVLEAIQEESEGREVITEAHASYVRIKVADECFVRFETVGDVLGRTVTRGDIEANMPSFAGFIRTEPDGIRFLAR